MSLRRRARSARGCCSAPVAVRSTAGMRRFRRWRTCCRCPNRRTASPSTAPSSTSASTTGCTAPGTRCCGWPTSTAHGRTRPASAGSSRSSAPGRSRASGPPSTGTAGRPATTYTWATLSTRFSPPPATAGLAPGTSAPAPRSACLTGPGATSAGALTRRSLTGSGRSTSGSSPAPRSAQHAERTIQRPASGRQPPAMAARLARMPRPDGRRPDQLREVRMTRGWLDHAEGSVLVEFGRTRVLCAASVTEDLPRWRRGSGLGWVTAEYAMLPRATNTRSDRESVKGRPGGRTQEISRLVGRSLRACIDPKALGDNTIVIDCDVLQADGGTRTAAITGGYVALADAIAWLRGRNRCKGDPLVASVSAISVGIVDGQPRLDLGYEEDSAAQTDMNVVCTGDGSFVEVQGTAEREPFGREMLDQLLGLAVAGCAELTRLQRAALAR